MPATPTQELIDEGKCFACYGSSTSDLLKLTEWGNISTMAPVASFINRAGITDATQIAALNALFTSSKSNGWWDKCDLIYPFVGGTAQAHAQNLKSANFTITWFGTLTHNANGVAGNGVDGYGDSGYSPDTSSIYSINSAHLGVYRRTSGTANGMRYAGTLRTVTLEDLQMFRSFIATAAFATINTLGGNAFAGTSLRFSAVSRNDNSAIHFFTGSSDLPAAQVATGIPNLPLYVLAFDNGGPAAGFSNASIAGLTCGSGLTFSEWTLMASDWQVFNTALGRQV